ncbi:MAG: Cna B-type domain-containing protein [Coriobacteriia bacterium]|nr:Cna B-type domain-containing protein [Coriobacteriia bacterium]
MQRTAYASESTPQEHSIDFDITRDSISDFDNVYPIYFNYWRNYPEAGVVDLDEWSLNDFSVDFELHVEGQSQSYIESMTYVASDYQWNGEIAFRNIPVPYNDIKVEYYLDENGDHIEPYLLHYDLYLDKADGFMVLRIPKLKPTKTGPVELTGDEKLLQLRKTLYLNGESGDDALDGFESETAVKSFEEAKARVLANRFITEIIVQGTTPIEGDISLAGTNAKIIRDSPDEENSYGDYLFSVPSGKTATLSHIEIDGNSEGNKEVTKSLILVNKKATLNIQDGAILKNNHIRNLGDKETNGGAIAAYSAKINMSGGSVENNKAVLGGGIYLSQSNMDFIGGTIQNNESQRAYDSYGDVHYSAGGGVLLREKSVLKMSGSAQVLNNHSAEVGGGISVNSTHTGGDCVFYMDGGIIDGNSSGSCGGGIFIQAGYLGLNPSKAYISAGKITNNIMDGTGYRNNYFGGGGIYVNGAPWSGVEGSNGELYLTNAIITDNTAEVFGGGYAACPITKTKIYVTDGAAIYNNQADKGKDVYVLCSFALGLHSGTPQYELSKRMLGGVPYQWKNDDGSLLAEAEYEGTLTAEGETLSLYTDEKGSELTQALAKVIISGNKSATRGGGIGSNGTVVIGTEADTIEVPVKKIWAGDEDAIDARPDQIKISLIASVKLEKDGKEQLVENIIDQQILNKENGWSYTFTHLPKTSNGKETSYRVEEEPVEGYSATISGSAEEGFILTNTKTPPDTPPSTPPSTPPYNPPHTPPSTRPYYPSSKVVIPKTGDDNRALWSLALASVFAATGAMGFMFSQNKRSRKLEE